MPHLEIRQILMGHPEVFTNMEYVQISTMPFDLRPKKLVNLDTKGNVRYNQDTNNNCNTNPIDNYSSDPPLQHICILKNLPKQQQMTSSQIGTYQNHESENSARYDMSDVLPLLDEGRTI